MADSVVPELVSAQLERMLARPPLVTSPSLSRLLRFLVNETLGGRVAEINEYHIGVRVFERGGDFNPRSDPIVRVQTHHLRARLARYYAGPGASDPLVIELRPRTYVPQFRQVAFFETPEGQAAPVETAVETAGTPVETPAGAARPGGTGRAVVAACLATVLAMAAGLGFAARASRQPAHHEPQTAALNLYARGRYLLDRQTEPALRQAAECFRLATSRDAQFAAAFAGLADAYNLLAQNGYMQPHEGMEEARRAAKRAIALDSSLAEGYVSLAVISEAYDWDFQTAEREYRHALALNPELPAAHLWFGMFLRDQGRMTEALAELRRAEQLEPLSVEASLTLAYTLRMTGDLDAALELARRAEEMNPDVPVTDVMLADLYRSHAGSGDADAALQHARRLAAGDPHVLSLVACTYAQLGRRGESEDLLGQMQQLAAERYVSPFDLGNVAATLGDADRAASWYEEAYRQRSAGIVLLRNEKRGTMESPRLKSLMRKMGNG